MTTPLSPSPPPPPPASSLAASSPAGIEDTERKISSESAPLEQDLCCGGEAENAFPDQVSGSSGLFWSPFSRSRKRPGSWKHPGGTVSETEEWDNSEPDLERDREGNNFKIMIANVCQLRPPEQLG